MEHGLPEPIDSMAFARGHRSLSGRLPGSSLARLAEAGATADGDLSWEALGTTGRDELDRLREFLTLRLTFTPILSCARCLEPLRLDPIAVERRFRFAASEDQAAREDRDAGEIDVIAHDRTLALADLIEDEALLSLPMAAAHDKCPDRL